MSLGDCKAPGGGARRFRWARGVDHGSGSLWILEWGCSGSMVLVRGRVNGGIGARRRAAASEDIAGGLGDLAPRVLPARGEAAQPTDRRRRPLARRLVAPRHGGVRPPAPYPEGPAAGQDDPDLDRELGELEKVVLHRLPAPNPDFSPVVWKKAVPRGIICSGSTGYADIRGRPYEHRV
jgi:hypothetical protein